MVRGSRKPQAALAYAYGALSHFALDVACHPYVDEKIAASGVTHTRIEVEFDRSLMLSDGLNPVAHVLTDHIRPARANAEIVAPFYPGVTARQAERALRSMIFYNQVLLARTDGKRKLLYAALRAAGKYQQLSGHIVDPQGDPVCADSNAGLLERYGLALDRMPELLRAFDRYLAGAEDLPELFDHTFDGNLPEKERK